MRLRILAAIFFLIASIGWCETAKYPVETKNAALRYWMAFAEMRDTPADKATQELLEKTADGEAAWDEARLAPVIDANTDAIAMMQRATKLPECDWGLEYSMGPRASIAYAPRARALARLNTLAGIRALAKGDSQSALNAWLAGIRFAQDLAHGGSLIFALMGKAVLLPDLHLLAEAARNGKLNEAEKKQVLASVEAVPADGFDWAASWELESVTIENTLRELQSASDSRAKYEELMGKTAPMQGFPPTLQYIQKCREYMKAVRDALREPTDKARLEIEGLKSERNELGEAERNMIPSGERVNEARGDVMKARANLLSALGQ
jgi:hypothetical protein